MFVALAALILAGCAPAGGLVGAPAAKVEKPSELKIALVDFQSGPFAKFGLTALNSGQLLLDQINQEGGIAGVKARYSLVDENGSVEQQVTEYRRLVLDEKVDVVMGYTSSANCLGIAPVAEELKKLTIIHICGTNRLFEEGQYKYVFRTSAHLAADNVSAALYVLQAKPDVKTIAGINQDYAWGRDSWEVFKRVMLKLKPDVKVLDELWPKLGQGEFSAEISKLATTKADVVHSSFFGGDYDTFIKQGAPRGIFKDSLYLFTTGETGLLTIGKDMPQGIALTGRGQYLLFPDPDKNPLNKKFIESYQARWGEFPIYPSYRMAQAVLGTKVAFEKASKLKGGGWPTADEVAAAFENLGWDTPGGPIVMRPDHQAVQPALWGITSGQLQPKLGFPTLERIQTFSTTLVTPPLGMKTLDWIDSWPAAAK